MKTMRKKGTPFAPHPFAQALLQAKGYADGGEVAPQNTVFSGGPATAKSGDAGFFGTLFGQNNYEANLAPMQQTNYGGVINSAAGNALAGYQNAQNIQAQQQALADTFLRQSRGEGPNPAQAALAQATGQNVAQQAALMGSQRGASGNVGLMARQAAQQGAGIQQTAVGQAATMQAQQQLAAQQALAQQQAAMAQGNLGQQGLQANLFGTAAGAQNAQNNSNIANYGMVQGINSGVAAGNSANASRITGALIGSAGAAGAAYAGKPPVGAAHGAVVPGKAKVPGDSPANDTVPAMLSPGEIVIPRSHASDPDKARQFVEQELAKRSSKPKNPHLEQMMQAHKALGEAIQRMSEGGEVEDVGAQPMGMMSAPGSVPMGVSESSPLPSAGSALQAEPMPALPGVPLAAEQAANPQAMPAPQPQQQPGAPTDMSKELMDLQAKQMGAAEKSASALAQGQTDAAKIYADQAKEAENDARMFQEKRAELDREEAELQKQYQTQQIDPHRVLGSTGSKIGAAIAIMLGGLGQGMTGGRNMAMDVINKAIDDDIDSQKANLGKTANLLTMNMHKYRNLEQAEQVTRMQKLAAVQSRIAAASAKSGSQQALANGQMLAAQIQERMIPLKNHLATQRAFQQKMQSGQTLTGQDLQALPKEQRESFVQGRGIQGVAFTPEGAKGIRDSIGTVDSASKSIKGLIDIAQNKGRQFLPSEASAQAETLAAMLKGALRAEIVGPGAVSASEWKLLDSIVADPTRVLQLDSNTLTRLKTLEKSLDQGLKSKAKAQGLNTGEIPSRREGWK